MLVQTAHLFPCRCQWLCCEGSKVLRRQFCGQRLLWLGESGRNGRCRCVKTSRESKKVQVQKPFCVRGGKKSYLGPTVFLFEEGRSLGTWHFSKRWLYMCLITIRACADRYGWSSRLGSARFKGVVCAVAAVMNKSYLYLGVWSSPRQDPVHFLAKLTFVRDFLLLSSNYAGKQLADKAVWLYSCTCKVSKGKPEVISTAVLIRKLAKALPRKGQRLADDNQRRVCHSVCRQWALSVRGPALLSWTICSSCKIALKMIQVFVEELERVRCSLKCC